MSEAEITLYGTTWCGASTRARNFLEQHNIPFKYVDIDQDKDGEAFVLKTNRGMRSVPTLLFPNGDTLTEPAIITLAQKVGVDFT